MILHVKFLPSDTIYYANGVTMLNSTIDYIHLYAKVDYSELTYVLNDTKHTILDDHTFESSSERVIQLLSNVVIADNPIKKTIFTRWELGDAFYYYSGYTRTYVSRVVEKISIIIDDNDQVDIFYVLAGQTYKESKLVSFMGPISGLNFPQEEGLVLQKISTLYQQGDTVWCLDCGEIRNIDIKEVEIVKRVIDSYTTETISRYRIDSTSDKYFYDGDLYSTQEDLRRALFPNII